MAEQEKKVILALLDDRKIPEEEQVELERQLSRDEPAPQAA